MMGTKIGCREGDCGACTILIGEIREGKLVYSSATSCLMPLGNASGKHIVTIEGLNLTTGLNGVQQAFANEGATQCGFCTPGFIVSLCGYCLSNEEVSYQSAIDAMNGNICRCTGYKSIERAAAFITSLLRERNPVNAIEFAIEKNLVPGSFSTILQKLKELSSNGIGNFRGKFVAGGTDLYVQQHDTITHEDIELMSGKSELKGITVSDSVCEIGAAVTVTDIATSAVFKKHFPDLSRYIKLVSSTQIRNMATIAGNIINASPIGDFSIFLLALDAQLILSNGKTKRNIPLRKLYKGYKVLDKTPDEYIEKILFRLPDQDCLFNFEKVSKRTHLDIASVNSAVFLKMKNDTIIEAGISAGGVAAIPAYLVDSSKFLTGKKVNKSLVEDLLFIIQKEISPISDARGTSEYKRLLLQQLVKAHFITLFPLLATELIQLHHAEY